MNQKAVYLERPWLSSYLPSSPHAVEVPPISVRDAFDEVTDKWKDRTALYFYGRKISFKELRDKVDRLATALADLGVKKGDRIAVLLLNSPEYIIASYAAFKLGAIVTAVSPVYVSSEIKHQLEDSGAEHLICQDILYEAVEKTGVEFKNVILTNISESLPTLTKLIGKSILSAVYQKMAAPSPEILKKEGVHTLVDLIKKYKPNPPHVEITPDDLITLPYTGGTTGPPKGVMLSHGNVIAAVAIYKAANMFLEDGKETIIGLMPFYHAGGQFNAVFYSVLSGYKIAILTTPEPDELLYTVTSQKPTFFISAPSLFEKLKDYEKTDRVDWKKFKIITSGGDALNDYTAKDWEVKTGVKLHEVYGMTEFVCLSHCVPLGKVKIGSVGIPMPGVLAAIADQDKDEFLPIGELGEIVVHGALVTNGYWNNPEATKACEAYIDGIRWWRTGDLSRMDENGYFYIYDRKRDLIKYKGLRVYAREVEEVIKSHPKIKEVGVVGVKDIKVGENVKAFVVLETDARGHLSEGEIMEYCKDKLAHYKIPKIVEFVGEIPKTDIGKVSRRDLREED
ncbi:MAG TPA: AMP-binding protein [Syntrophales bacterium]|nr:AMP-binding protein [Syntrophales bacterium]